MQILIVREACCAADDQLGPLEAKYEIAPNGTLGELVAQIRASRFLQFSSTHDRLSGEVDGACLVEICASGGPPPTFHVDQTSLVAHVIGSRTFSFFFRHV